MTYVKKDIINNQRFTIMQGRIVLQKDMKCSVNEEQQKTSTGQCKFD